MAYPLCTCGHAHDDHAGFAGVCLADSECPCDSYCPPGSLEDILGVWRDQGPFPLRNTDDVKLLIDEIERLRALVLTTAARATTDTAEHTAHLEACLRDMVIATGPLDRGDAPSEALFNLLDVRHRACDVLDLDPAGHDWPTES